MDDDCIAVRVVGVSHYQAALATCSPGEVVYLCHEPDNPFDELAIRIETSLGERIGYVPRSSGLRKAIHEEGRGVAATIYSVGEGRSCQLGAVLSVTLTDDPVKLRSYFPDRDPPEPPAGGYRWWVEKIKSPSGDVQFEAARR